MELVTFNKLLNSVRIAQTMETGKYITCRFAAPNLVYLYFLRNFYVEIWEVRSASGPAWCHGFSTLEKLEPYLEQINLPDVNKRGSTGSLFCLGKTKLFMVPDTSYAGVPLFYCRRRLLIF